jgi:hypothetical protein
MHRSNKKSIDLLKVEYTPTDRVGPEPTNQIPFFVVRIVILGRSWG